MMKKNKMLLATTDYFDNILGRSQLFSRKHLDSLHHYLRAIGVDRHQWMFNPVYTFYDPIPDGFDLIREAVASAHAHGLEFFAVLKPFEGGGSGNALPLSSPTPKGVRFVKDMRGIHPVVRALVAERPQWCLQRRPGTFRAVGPVASIRLVKQDDKPTRLKPEHLSLWTSDKNNNFQRYDGPISFRETVEWRSGFPKSRFCRVFHLEDLRLNAKHPYLLIRCSLADGDGDFANERGKLVELINDQHAEIPIILSSGRTGFTSMRDQYPEIWDTILPYFQSPEVKKILQEDGGAGLYRDFYAFEERQKVTEVHVLDKVGYVAVACGKPEYLTGNLHPIYPEVRRYWLDMLRFCLDRGVDGVNIRTANHSRSPEAWEYGFNAPVLQAAGGRTDYPTVRRINGDAYTLFLRQARDLVKSYGKSITIHLYSQMLMPDDRGEQLSYIPLNFDWQWQTWVQEIADDLEFRGAWTLRPWNLRKVLETFSSVTQASGKPFYFQCNMKELGFAGPHRFTAAEIEMVKRNPALDGLVLYETANFTQMEKEGILGSEDLASLLKEKWNRAADE